MYENRDELEKSLIECFDIIRNLFMFIYSPTHSNIPIDKKVIFNYLNDLSDLYKIEALRTNTRRNDQLSMTKSESIRTKGITGETFVPTIYNK